MKSLSKVFGFVLILASFSGVAWAIPGDTPTSTPEIDPGSLTAALTLLSGGVMMLTSRRRKA